MKKISRITLGIIAVVCFIWFIIPLSLSTSLNIGNATGLTISVLLLLVAIFLPVIQEIIKRWKSHPVKKWFYRTIVMGIGVIVTLVIVESSLMMIAASKSPTENVTVVILGCRVYGENPSLSMVERLDAAYEFLEAHEDVQCVLAGGKGDGENITEAECMYRYLIAKGIDEKRLYKEEHSTTTRENLLYAKQIIEENHLAQTIAIATSEYHVYRAGEIAKALGMEYRAIPGKTAIWLFPTYYVRELYGILYEWVF